MISQPTASSEDEIGEIHIVGHENNSMNDIALCSSWLVAGSQVVIARTLGTSEYRGGGRGGTIINLLLYLLTINYQRM